RGALPFVHRGVAFAHATFARREARLRLLMARLERRALALELALALADLGELLRQLSSCFRPVPLGGLKLFGSALPAARQLLHPGVLGDDLRVPLDQRGLLALKLGNLPFVRVLPLVELLRPPVDLRLAILDRAGGRFELVVHRALTIERSCQLGPRSLELG